ncbi:MAG: hypothetical protein EOP83_16865, partial [Verrucomicrobiaceae bacterium]
MDVQIIDESFYGSAGAGTIPLIVMATASNKTSASGSGYAPYTTPAQAGKVFLATSQRELIQNYGNPNFYSIQGTAIHGHELNEYGLHAAYQYLSISNRAYVMRADIDLAQLEASVTAPRGAPLAGQYWLDVGATAWGVFQSNGNSIAGVAWESKTVLVASDDDVTDSAGKDVPLASFGANGQFAVVITTADNRIFEKIAGAWYEIGSTGWKSARPTTIQSAVNPPVVAEGSQFIINGTTIVVGVDGSLPAIRQAILDANIPNIAADIAASRLVIKNTAGGNLIIENRNLTPLATLGFTSGTFKGPAVTRTADAQYPTGSTFGDVWVKGTTPNKGANWVVKLYDATSLTYNTLTAPFFPFDATKSETDATKDMAANAVMGVPAVGTVYVAFDAATGVQMLRRYNGTGYEPLAYVASPIEPSEEPQDGTLWYNADFRVDIMVGDGNTWLGYKRQYPNTDPKGVILSGSQPTTQTDGTPLVESERSRTS